ncbi:FABP family protein [Marinitenerispora sediminis]|uniref:Ferric nitrobindin-like protein n=1 Tax=Marinitenerispora sediminis TaxID=1931232 RepID=A0A368T7I4_9ACTN|nr:FABP family protein [Marinitenerispora sediminis]RCV51085.1 FABP family protein [Marinitenerispora sediminis]RCV56582.1 FABP family protein [Marinitenerispora sediminis]RCV60080.1 FABP family protein [Marinitenerispora sediminis]
MQQEVHPDLERLSFLLGRWEGVGVAGYPGLPEFQFGQEVEFTHDGGPYLSYRSRVWRVREDGTLGDFVTAESGYWRARPRPEGAAAGAEGSRDAGTVHLEVLISHPEGFTEVYLGTIFASRVELSTDAVLRTETGQAVAAGHRLYGLFGENRETLGYAWDLAADGHDLRPYMSAQLKRAA